jgi:hypothetical protein
MASSAEEIYTILAEGFDQAAAAGQLDVALDEFMAEVVTVWQGYSPVRTGAYKNSVQITEPARDGKGQVGATSVKANLIEYGSEHNPEFAPRAKTIEYFNRPQT